MNLRQRDITDRLVAMRGKRKADAWERRRLKQDREELEFEVRALAGHIKHPKFARRSRLSAEMAFGASY